MKNTLHIILHDFKRLTSSVVAIVILMGLCIVPCLYAWFNILSNWDPYEADATGRIPVAVYSEDEGAEMLGLYINVGEKITEALKANDSIGWVFTESKEETLEGTRSGKYYVALVIPADFSDSIMSFTTGELRQPEIEYYENVKKNAIAPIITGKAKTALQQEVDAAFVETLGEYIADGAAVAEAAGLEPGQMFGDLGQRMNSLDGMLEESILMLQTVSDLSVAADQLLKASQVLIGGSRDTLTAGQKMLTAGEQAMPQAEDNRPVTAAVRNEAAAITQVLQSLNDELADLGSDADLVHNFTDSKLDFRLEQVREMSSSAVDTADRLNTLGLTGLAGHFMDLSDRLDRIDDKLAGISNADEMAWADVQATLTGLTEDITQAEAIAARIEKEAEGDLDRKVNQILAETGNSIAQLRDALTQIYGDLGSLNTTLSGTEQALQNLSGGLDQTILTAASLQQGLRSLSAIFENLAGSARFRDINHLTTSSAEEIARNLASPISMETEVIYPIGNYGSAMAPFYTVLAQWVGALLATVLISAKVRSREELGEVKLRERFFGRYRLYLFVGLAQALIVSLGDLLYVGIQCEHPVKFVLAACMNGIAFTMINYALKFALDNIGLALGVIVLVLQVAGAGGTFPAEVLPAEFQALYPFMPFRYAMDAMRECVAGAYGNTWLKCMAVLLVFTVASAVIGLLLYRPAQRLNRLISESMRSSDLLHE